MEAKFCPQCGTKLKEDALFCSECGYKIKDKIGTEDLNTNTISKSEVPEIKNEGNKISCNESKKSISDYINIFKEKWHLSKKNYNCYNCCGTIFVITCNCVVE